MRTLIISISVVILIGCKSNSANERDSSNTSDSISELVVKIDSLELTDAAGELLNSVVLSESKINDIDLPFPLKDMTKDLESLFHDCSIKKEVGKQDGPDFPLYSIKCGNKEIGFFASIRSKKQGKFLNQDSKLTKAQNISANLIILAR
ncbi:MAG: hypothetical protein GY756_20455 [bacterium]|nr:hypothetical protein [bacterium]